jgi:FtsP/CotA-like multicopper oxidase with cupredoxin domain
MIPRIVSAAVFPLLLVPALLAQTTPVPCPATGQPLAPIPEITRTAATATLSGTMSAVARQVVMPFRVGALGTGSTCYKQTVRAYIPGTTPPASDAPIPGPTLRARIGDLVQLTFLNLLDPLSFPGTDTGKCDQTSNYPGVGAGMDTFPDCFHGSIITNMHFHGTHTNPNSTGDNVFLQVVPSPRASNASRTPTVTAASVAGPFGDFFRQCAAQLAPANPTTRQWPVTFPSVAPSWQTMQAGLISAFPSLKASNDELIAAGAWPQYFIGAFPFCFRLPNYTSPTWPPAPSAALTGAHSAGVGSGHPQQQDTVLPLIMGQAPGTHWYHAHKHGSTTINVSNGMTGVFIIEGPYDDAIKAYYGSGLTQSVMVINQLGNTPNLERGAGGQFQGADFSVNGAQQPAIAMAPSEVQMWRIANTSSRAGVYLIAPTSGGLTWKQLARDGVQFTQKNYDASLNQPLLLEAGSRVDLLVKAPGAAATGVKFLVYNSVDPSDRIPAAKPVPLTLLTVNVSGTAKTGNQAQFMPTAPAPLPFLADITDEEIKATRNILFSTELAGNAAGIPAQHKIDGKKFDGNVGAVVLLNQTEEWKIANATYAAGPITPISHPFHIHINPFQVSEIFDPNETFLVNNVATPRYVTANPTSQQCLIELDKPSTWKPCAAVPKPPNVWRDVFSIPSGKQFTAADGSLKGVPGYFKLRSRFVDYYGYYVIHCHILAHEDRGMMTVVQVAPLQTPFSHH